MSKQKNKFTIAEVKISSRGNSRFQRAFTLIELLIVISIIALLLSILIPAMQRARKQARMVVCQHNMKQWGLMFSMYCDDNRDRFFTGELNGSRFDPINAGSGKYWRECMRPYSHDKEMWLCPAATREQQDEIPVGELPNVAWEHDQDVGSYGLNGWVLNIAASQDPENRDDGWERLDIDSDGGPRHWGTPLVKKAGTIPVFTDMWWVDAWPRGDDVPPPVQTGPDDTINENEMRRVCVNRHDGFINGTFMDWSVRKIGLKELWTLKWNRIFDTKNRWTLAGGTRPSWWNGAAPWMRRFKIY
jgi:prepilin-type N-terminal cleavage/methylation domain-containing protein